MEKDRGLAAFSANHKNRSGVVVLSLPFLSRSHDLWRLVSKLAGEVRRNDNPKIGTVVAAWCPFFEPADHDSLHRAILFEVASHALRNELDGAVSVGRNGHSKAT